MTNKKTSPHDILMPITGELAKEIRAISAVNQGLPKTAIVRMLLHRGLESVALDGLSIRIPTSEGANAPAVG